MATTTTTKPAANKAQAEATAKAALAKKREEAELAAKIEEYRRDVPPGIGEVEAELRAQIDELKRKPPVHLYAAIRAAQGKIETVRKNGENPHYHSKYATLDEIWENVRKPLNDAGLIVLCDVYTANGERLLTTRVIHAETGEEASCTFPIMAANNSPQAIGSAMTYARRYTLTALLEIVTGDGADDDGEAAENNHNTPSNGTTRNPSASAASDALGF